MIRVLAILMPIALAATPIAIIKWANEYNYTPMVLYAAPFLPFIALLEPDFVFELIKDEDNKAVLQGWLDG